jgi:phage FluMu protein Com
MNLRCIYCQTPFTLPRAEMLNAIITMNERHQSHYDAHCPRCRRANSISRQRMELFFPNWQDAAKELASAARKEELAASALLKAETQLKAVKEKKAPAEKAAPKAKPAEAKTKKPAVKTAEAKPKKKQA